MIKSDAQRDRTVAQIEGFQQALAKASQEKPDKRSAAVRRSYEGMIRHLEDELHEYDQLKSGVLTLPLVERQSQYARLQLIVFVQFIFEVPNHALIAPTDRGGALVRLLLARLGKCLLKAFNLGHGSISLRVALDHDSSPLTT